MAHYEYKVVPAPRRGEKLRGVRASEDRFAIALASVMNAQAADGWEYQRTETLPSEKREGLMGKATVFQNMMVFRRMKTAPSPTVAPVPMIEDKRDDTPPQDAVASTEPTAGSQVPPLTAAAAPASPDAEPVPKP
ncbi:DUF4177 domain-containing protein [Loktanella sp. DJP18]|uniref:DUF4177 domain-containing protein n=1 Tax=Loktanella sp. DJP18 TaxID=3409788 RepID=UPI003BB5C81E